MTLSERQREFLEIVRRTATEALDDIKSGRKPNNRIIRDEVLMPKIEEDDLAQDDHTGEFHHYSMVLAGCDEALEHGKIPSMYADYFPQVPEDVKKLFEGGLEGSF